MTPPFVFSADPAQWERRLASPGRWRLERQGVLLEIARGTTTRTRGELTIALVRPCLVLGFGGLVEGETRHPLADAVPTEPDPRDGDGAPLHAALALAGRYLGDDAAAVVAALDATGDVWADALGASAQASAIAPGEAFNEGIRIRVCALYRQGVGEIAQIAPGYALLSRLAPMLARRETQEAKRPFRSPAASAHERLERRARAETLLAALGQDPADLLPAADPDA